MRQVMLEPTTANLESFLGQVVSERDRLGKAAGPQQAAQQDSVLYQDASPTDTNDATTR